MLIRKKRRFFLAFSAYLSLCNFAELQLFQNFIRPYTVARENWISDTTETAAKQYKNVFISCIINIIKQFYYL